MRSLYTLLLYVLQPLIWLHLLWRSCKAPAYRRHWLERYGFVAGTIPPRGLIIHCASVGELRAALPLIQALRQAHPQLAITVTTNTPTGRERAQLALGACVHYAYLPFDLPGALGRFLHHLQPQCVIILERELWPNLLYALYRRQIPVVLANATISEHSFRRYRKLRGLVQEMMQHITLVAAQHPPAGERFIALGLPPQRLVVVGNLKFELTLTPELLAQAALLKKTWGSRRPVWIAASTHSGEEQIVLGAHRLLLSYWPDLLLLLVPRHPERFLSVEKLIKKFGLRIEKRSNAHLITEQSQVVLGDSMGELLLLYGVADIAFVGGSLVPCGGHNPLEPAAHALPILMGPHQANCKEICQLLQDACGLTLVHDTDSLARSLTSLLSNKTLCREQGNRALQLFSQNQAVLPRLLQQLQPYLPSGGA